MTRLAQEGWDENMIGLRSKKRQQSADKFGVEESESVGERM